MHAPSLLTLFKDRAAEGALLEGAAAAVESEVGLLGDCLQGGPGPAAGPGLSEGVAAAAGEAARFLGQVSGRVERVLFR